MVLLAQHNLGCTHFRSPTSFVDNFKHTMEQWRAEVLWCPGQPIF